MGYACPVCGDPQADDEHLADHLAFTAMLGDDEHEAWLDEHAPGWGQAGAAELAERVVEHAEAVEFPQVFEDTVERDSTSARKEIEREHTPRGRSAGELDAETRRVLAEARELTRRMLDEGGDGEEDEAGEEDE